MGAAAQADVAGPVAPEVEPMAEATLASVGKTVEEVEGAATTAMVGGQAAVGAMAAAASAVRQRG